MKRILMSLAAAIVTESCFSSCAVQILLGDALPDSEGEEMPAEEEEATDREECRGTDALAGAETWLMTIPWIEPQLIADAAVLENGGAMAVGQDGMIIKLNGGGGISWQKKVEGRLISVSDAGGGGVLIAGELEGDDYDTDILMLEMDAAGSIVWQKTAHEIGDEAHSEEAVAIARCSDGGAAAAGIIHPKSGDPRRTVVIKLDAGGDPVWQKAFEAPDCRASALIETRDGGLLMRGHVMVTTESYGLWLLKLDGQGNVQWSRRSNTAMGGGPKSIVEDPEGNLNLTGVIMAGWANLWVAKADSEGRFIWQISLYFEEIRNGEAASVFRTRDGGIVLSGEPLYYQNILVAKLDYDGHMTWAKELLVSAPNTAAAAAESDDGHVIFAGGISREGFSTDSAVLFARLGGGGDILEGCDQVRDFSPAVSPTQEVMVEQEVTSAEADLEIADATLLPMDVPASACSLCP